MGKKPYRYEFSPSAVDDLTEIFDYVTLELSSPLAAEKLIDEIQEAVENLCEFPFSRPLVKDRTLSKKGYRLLVVKNFNIFYVIRGEVVVIRRVLHGRRKFESLL